MTRALITGISGFTGGHLAHHLASLGWPVAGFARTGTHLRGDLADRASVRTALAETDPDVVIHLAGALRAREPDELYVANVLGTVSLLEAIVELQIRPVVIVVSSSAVYGAAGGDEPIDERVEARPRTHYGASKLAQEAVAQRYVDAHGLPIVRVRPFNLLGPGLSPELACGAFAERIVRAERDPTVGSLRTGNLDALRDFTDVRDVVRAYAALAECGQPGEVYNVCSQRSVSIRHCVETLVQRAARPIDIELDPALLQQTDVAIQTGSHAKLAALTGWAPTIPIERSLEDMLDHTRRRIER